MQIGDVITKMRLLKGVSLNDMANEVQVSKEYLWMIEKNTKKPSNKVLKNIASYFNVPVSAILFEMLTADGFIDKKHKQLFEKAKPILDKCIELLIANK